MTDNINVKAITEENDKEEISGWFNEAKQQSLGTLPHFIHHLMYDYRHDYGTIVHAISACSIAAAWACDRSLQGGITGFQSGFVMWDFIKHWSYETNKCGLRLLNYDNLLYPQYEKQFRPTISKSAWEEVQKKAKEELASIDYEAPFIAADSVIEHWKRIAAGIVPFGLTVVDSY